MPKFSNDSSSIFAYSHVYKLCLIFLERSGCSAMNEYTIHPSYFLFACLIFMENQYTHSPTGNTV